jgi:hypothetical protein
MRLKEMFSPVGGPTDKDSDVDWIGDLKFFMDHNDSIVRDLILPAVQKHKTSPKAPNAFKLYIMPVMKCRKMYADQFKVDDVEKKISHKEVIKIARKMAEEQSKHIEKKDYEN